MKASKLLAGIAAVIAGTAFATASYSQTVLKLSHTDQLTGGRHAASLLFAKKVEEYTQGLGVVGPAGIPAPVVARLNEAIRASLVKPETREKLKGLGAITEGGSTPAEFRAWLAKDLERWSRVIMMAGVKAE